MDGLLNILHEDEDLLVVNKPAGLVCHPTKGDERSSLIGRIRLRLGAGGKGQLLNRLDRETSGIVLVAKGETAAREIRGLLEARWVRKAYVALVHGWPENDRGRVEGRIGRDEASPVAIKRTVRPDGAPARTHYVVAHRFERPEGRFARLEIHPETGRTHQIRVHLAQLGHPIVGDKIYGGDEGRYLDFVRGRLTVEQQAALILPCHALHAAELGFEWRGKDREFIARPEDWFEDFAAGRALSVSWEKRYV